LKGQFNQSWDEQEVVGNLLETKNLKENLNSQPTDERMGGQMDRQTAEQTDIEQFDRRMNV
jgi:hypothetical protein